MSLLQKIFTPLQPSQTHILSELKDPNLNNYFIIKNSQGQDE